MQFPFPSRRFHRSTPLRLEILEKRDLLFGDLFADFELVLEPLELESTPAILATVPMAFSAGQLANAEAPNLSVPAYSSLPGAADALYLDFNGDFQSTWGTFTNVDTPPYDIDGTPGAFSAAELANIRDIWAQVAEDFAPFNLNVTTVAPASFSNGVGLHVVIGGNGSWAGGTYGGIAYVNSYTNSAPNVNYVFSGNLAGGAAKYVAEAASHESGHAFGLQHQSTYDSSGSRVEEYNPGSAGAAPIMGNSYSAARGLWWNGTSTSRTTLQDDLAVLAQPNNTFAYRPDDYGDTIANASPLPITNGTTVNASGIVGSTQDSDVFSFTTSAGQVSFQLSGASVGGNLDGVLELRNSAGATLVTAAPANSLGATLTTTVAAGTYYLVAKSQGGYGAVGQYTVSGTLPSSQQVPSSTTIIDNSDTRFTTTGGWTAYPAQGYLNNMHYTGLGASRVATWSTDVSPGQYVVEVTWYAHPNRASNAPYTVLDGSTPRGTTLVNQRQSPAGPLDQGVTWQTLGTYTITGSRLVVQLSNNANGYVIADAIRIRPVTVAVPASPIIDNSDVRFTTTGSWTAYPAQGYLNNMHYAGLGAPRVATWSADVAPGQYAVDVTWYADPNRATNAPYTVLDGSTARGTTLVNQQQSPSGALDQGVTWQTLGTYTITGGRLIVQLSNNANGYVIADAIRIREVGAAAASSGGLIPLAATAGGQEVSRPQDPRASALFWDSLLSELGGSGNASETCRQHGRSHKRDRVGAFLEQRS